MAIDPTSERVAALARQAHALATQGQAAASRQAWEQVLALAPGHAVALNYLGQEAFARGDLASARAMLEQATATAPTFALAHANLARVRRGLGDRAGALKSLDAALKWEPQAFPAHLEKAAIYEELGQERHAALAYESAMKMMPARAAGAPELQARLQRAQQVVADNRSQLARFLGERLRDARAPQSARALSRFDESLDIATGLKPLYQPRPAMFPIAGLPAIAFFDREDFSWAPAVEAATADVRAELEQVLADDAAGFVPYVQTTEGEPPGQFAALDGSLSWGAYFLWQHGRRIDAHMARCPRTMAALDHAPQVEVTARAPAAFFSALQPRTHIPAHNGATNCRLTVHLPLIIPPDCALRVGNHTRTWTPGELLIFDDTMEHEAWNRSDQLRVVLIFDIWHPLLSAAERVMVRTALEGIMDYYGEGAPLGEL